MDKQQLKEYSYFGAHNHTYYSNLRLKDAIVKPEGLIDKAHKMGLLGLAVTEHEVLSSHIRMQKYVRDNRDKLGDFKLALGNEIYLVDKSTLEQKENNEKVRYNHFILVAKNAHGHEFLRKQSSKAWENSYTYRGMERVPSYYDEVKELMKDYKGDIIASTSCIGGRLPQLVLQYNENQTPKLKQEIHQFITWCQDVFGKDDFYFELQPSHQMEQLIVNQWLIKLSKAYGIKIIITTDTHYLTKDQKQIHKAYLQSQDGEREVDSFYDTTYLHSVEDLFEYFDDNLLTEMFTNTHDIMDKIEEYDLTHEIVIPQATIPEFTHITESDFGDLTNYPYIKDYINSESDSDKYYIKLIYDGMVKLKQEFNETTLGRINTELDVVRALSDYFKQPMSGYFLMIKEFIDLSWELSVVGVARGSASCFYTNYLLGIVQINALDYDLPYWRFLNKDRLDNMPDVDFDTEGGQRLNIIKLLKDRYGHDNVLNSATFSTEGTRSTILTACRGLGLEPAESQAMADLAPNDKGVEWNLHDAFYGNEKKGRKPDTRFIKAVESVPMLKETMLGTEGLVKGRSQHASAVFYTNEPYVTHNAMMKTKSHLPVTQFEAHDSESAGAIKYDFLTVNAMDKIRATMELLLKNNKIEWQGSLRETYNKYLHPDVLDLTSPEMYDMLFNGDVVGAFQFETMTGRQTLEKINARSFDELASANSLMRLSVPKGEQPVDKYVRFKNDINLWYQEMTEDGLTQDEQDILKEYLAPKYGVSDTQELLMSISMDKRISGFTLKEANKLRKSVAKKSEKAQDEQKEIFFEHGRKLGTSDALLNYVWFKEFALSFGYAFSAPHVDSYTLITLIEMNLCYRYGDIYWKTASLSVNAGISESENGSTDYEKVAKAIAGMHGLVISPDINKSDVGFTPSNDKILYGLGGIAGLSADEVNMIMDNRPYNTLDDVWKLELSNKKKTVLVKSGMLDSINPNRVEVMMDLVRSINPQKAKLTTVQLPKIINDVPNEFCKQVDAYKIKSLLFGRNSVKMNKKLEAKFMLEYSNYLDSDAYSYGDDGLLIVDKKKFEKWFNKFITPLKEWLKTDEATSIEARYRMNEFWTENCLGNASSWEFETLNCYISEHELNLTNLKEQLSVVDFDSLEANPTPIKFNKWRGNEYPVYKAEAIMGTVVDSDKRGIIYLNTTDNQIVNVRINKRKYAKYKERIMSGTGKNRHCVDEPWTSRGSKLLVVGYRRQNDFVANVRGSGYNTELMRINGYGENAKIQTERVEG